MDIIGELETANLMMSASYWPICLIPASTTAAIFPLLYNETSLLETNCSVELVSHDFTRASDTGRHFCRETSNWVVLIYLTTFTLLVG